MGIHADARRLTLGTLTQVLEFKRNDALLNKIKNGGLDDTDKMPRKLLEKDPERINDLRSLFLFGVRSARLTDRAHPKDRSVLLTGLGETFYNH